jgi:hypothetical protein
MSHHDTLLPDSPPSRASAEEIRRLLAGELTLPARLAHVALLLVALGGVVAVGSLWATEPALPVRTQVAFALLVGIGLSWVGYASWVLRRRRVLLAGHQVVATRMAVAFCGVLVAGALALGYWGPPARAPYAMATLGLVMLAVALTLHARARRTHARLLTRRRELEATLGGGGRP